MRVPQLPETPAPSFLMQSQSYDHPGHPQTQRPQQTYTGTPSRFDPSTCSFTQTASQTHAQATLFLNLARAREVSADSLKVVLDSEEKYGRGEKGEDIILRREKKREEIERLLEEAGG